MKKNVLHIIILAIGVSFLLFVLFHDLINREGLDLSSVDIIGLIFGSVLMLGGATLFIISKNDARLEKKNGRIKTNYIEIIVIILMVGSISWSGGYFQRYLQDQKNSITWSIGIYRVHDILTMNISNDGINNPVITKDDVTDMDAGFVADPFLIKFQTKFYMFFEVWNGRTKQGDISFSSSIDGFNWTYGGKVLDLDTHISYPQVFEWKGEYYMVPESGDSGRVMLFTTSSFPYNWELDTILLKGRNFKDPTLFHHLDTWYMFTSNTGGKNLDLFFSENLRGPWIEHPMSPLRKNDPDFCRPGGRIININGKIIRIAQDDYPSYGNQLWAFEIEELTRSEYKEKQLSEKPILTGYENWNFGGVHQLDILEIKEREWLACIDGKS